MIQKMIKAYDKISEIKINLVDRSLPKEIRSDLIRYFSNLTELSEDYFLVAEFLVENIEPDNRFLDKFISKIDKVLKKKSTEREFYFASVLLNGLSSNWTNSQKLANLAKVAIDNCENDEFYDLIYPSTIILGENIHNGLDEEYYEKLISFGKLFFDNGDHEAASFFSCGICIANEGPSPSCFRKDALNYFEKH